VQLVVDSLTDGSGGFHVEDDLTLMAIQFSAARYSWRLEPDLAGDGVRQAQVWLREILAAHVDAARIGEVELIAEEVLTNVARAAAGGPVRASVHCALVTGAIVLTFRDDGAPFDPLEHHRPDLDEDAARRTVGGLGIHIVRELAADIRYARAGGENVLTVQLARKEFV